jgi:hypothetical protein
VAVGNYAYNGTILTSSDGISWTVNSVLNFGRIYRVTYSNNSFMIVGFSGTILISSDPSSSGGTFGTAWTIMTSGTSNALYEVTYKE